MRTHQDIITAVGAEKIAAALELSSNTTRSWSRRNSIPAEHWLAFVERKWAKLPELAAHAARKIAA